MTSFSVLKDDKYQIYFLRVVLDILNNDYKETYEKDEFSIFYGNTYPMNYLNKFLIGLNNNEFTTTSNQESIDHSFYFFTKSDYFAFRPRLNSSYDYNIDYPCFVYEKYGDEYQSKDWLKRVENDLRYSEKSYSNLKTAGFLYQISEYF